MKKILNKVNINEYVGLKIGKQRLTACFRLPDWSDFFVFFNKSI